MHLDVCVRVMRVSYAHDFSVFGKVDQASSLLKGRTFFYIRDETYADAFTREVAERSVGKAHAVFWRIACTQANMQVYINTCVCACACAYTHTCMHTHTQQGQPGRRVHMYK